MPDSASIGFKWEWNINTVAVLLGFVGGFVAWGYTLSEIKSGRDQNARDIQNLITHVSTLDARIQLIERAEAKNDQLEYRLAQNEKAVETIDVRIGRVTESYSNQFADFRTQLSSISTQIALTNQTLQRIEARPPVSSREP